MSVPLVGALVVGVCAPGCGDDAARTRSAPASASAGGAALEAVDGAPSVDELFAKAQRAVETGDDLTLVRLIRPETRELWLRDLVVDVAVESSTAPIEASADRERRGRFRALLASHGAVLGSRPKSLATLGDALLENVRDRVGLFAALLALARVYGAAYDPVRALTKATAPTATGLPLVRIAQRVRPPAALVDLASPLPLGSATGSASSGPVAPPGETASAVAPGAATALPATPRAGPSSPGASVVFVSTSDGAIPLRLWSDGARFWLDES